MCDWSHSDVINGLQFKMTASSNDERVSDSEFLIFKRWPPVLIDASVVFPCVCWRARSKSKRFSIVSIQSQRDLPDHCLIQAAVSLTFTNLPLFLCRPLSDRRKSRVLCRYKARHSYRRTKWPPAKLAEGRRTQIFLSFFSSPRAR